MQEGLKYYPLQEGEMGKSNIKIYSSLGVPKRFLSCKEHIVHYNVGLFNCNLLLKLTEDPLSFFPVVIFKMAAFPKVFLKAPESLRHKSLLSILSYDIHHIVSFEQFECVYLLEVPAKFYSFILFCSPTAYSYLLQGLSLDLSQYAMDLGKNIAGKCPGVGGWGGIQVFWCSHA